MDVIFLQKKDKKKKQKWNRRNMKNVKKQLLQFHVASVIKKNKRCCGEDPECKWDYFGKLTGWGCTRVSKDKTFQEQQIEKDEME